MHGAVTKTLAIISCCFSLCFFSLSAVVIAASMTGIVSQFAGCTAKGHVHVKHADAIPTSRSSPRSTPLKYPSTTCLSGKSHFELRFTRRSCIVAASTTLQETQEPLAEETDEYPWLEQWYPVFFVKYVLAPGHKHPFTCVHNLTPHTHPPHHHHPHRDLDTKAPNRFTLLNFPLVIWRNEQGAWSVFIDACPHRLVPLSEGRITPKVCAAAG